MGSASCGDGSGAQVTPFPCSRPVRGHTGDMRFLVALILGLAVMFGLNVAVDFFAMERPWGSILMGVTVGVTLLIVLLVWEAVRPTTAKGDSAKSQRSEEDRAKARADRRARLAAEAGVSLEGVEGALPGSSASPAEADSTEKTGNASEESDAPEAGNASEGPDPSAARDGDGSQASETEAVPGTEAAPGTEEDSGTEASDADASATDAETGASATGAETDADEPDADEKASGLEEPVDADEKSPVEDPDE